ncbi:MAG: hypothetical protein IJE01_07945 [Clostridia bacterium]|nr:hypothetical protein [Clostridia bacterium]
MEDKKIEYLKKHLEQALNDDNYNEANTCYQELLKHVTVNDIPELAQKINDYNKKQSGKTSQKINASADDIKKRTRTAKKKHNINVKIQIYGIAGGVGAMVLGCFLVMCGAGIFGLYSDPIMYSGLYVAIAGGALLLIGTIFAFIKNKSEIALNKCRSEVFKLICDGEDKLKYLEKVETFENVYYVGQVKADMAHGFGVGGYFDNNIGHGFYVGDYKNDSKSGIGKLITDDMLMTLEGEFKGNQANGVVDIQWEDGGEWHGEYKQGLPWNGQGKTIVKNKVQEGVWKNGMLIS